MMMQVLPWICIFFLRRVQMIYLDNGATSFPKPPEVLAAFMEAAEDYCANPGRSSHFMAARTAHEIFRARLAIASLFGIEDPGRIVFTKNCTEAINIALAGILRRGDHVVTSSMEHNSVMRPLWHLAGKGVEVTVVKCDRRGRLPLLDLAAAVRKNTRMIVLTAASNVTGTRMPVREAGKIAASSKALFMVDAAQGAGHIPLDVKRDHIDIMAAPGHKGLLGPQGTGFLYVREGTEPEPLLKGGTGTKSMDIWQPRDFPDGYEAGTLNSPGIIALGEGARFINRQGIESIEKKERMLTEALRKGLSSISKVELYGPLSAEDTTAVVAANIRGMDCEEAARILSDRFAIGVRAGFHCSGYAHRTIGTGKKGALRFCPGIYTSEDDIEKTLEAVEYIASSRL